MLIFYFVWISIANNGLPIQNFRIISQLLMTEDLMLKKVNIDNFCKMYIKKLGVIEIKQEQVIIIISENNGLQGSQYFFPTMPI